MFFPKSFYYFKLGILFFILCKIKNIKSREKRLLLFNKIEEFNMNKDIFEKIYKYIFKIKNCLIFTYYMQLPKIFFILPEKLIYYKPLICFYRNEDSIKDSIKDSNNNSKFSIIKHMKNYYTDRIKIDEHIKNKKIDYYTQDQHIFPDITTIFIPLYNNCLYYMDTFTMKEKDVLYIIYYENNIYVGRRYSSTNQPFNKFNMLYKKDKNKYITINEDIIINIDNLQYIMAMLPITEKELYKTFDFDVIKKDSLLYHNRSDDLRENIIRRFYSLYPSLNMINPFGLFNDADYHCFIYKLKKDLKVINLNRDIFYHDLFDTKDNSKDFVYKDTRNNKNLIHNKLFHCIGSKLENRKQCNFNVIKDYGNVNTWNRNKGKRMLCLIICKSSLYWLDGPFYYIDFLANFNITAFIYHYGIYKNKFLDVELGFCKNNDMYVEYISMHKGECNKFIL